MQAFTSGSSRGDAEEVGASDEDDEDEEEIPAPVGTAEHPVSTASATIGAR